MISQTTLLTPPGALQGIHMNHCTNFQPSDVKIPPALDKSIFENTMGNPFSNFFSFYRNAPKFFFRIDIWTNCFGNQFSSSRSCQTKKYANMHICLFSLSKVKNGFRKQFWNKRVHISILNKSLGAFWWKEKKVRKWISHRIFKNGFVRCRVLFSHLRAENWHFFIKENLLHKKQKNSNSD